MAGQGAQKAGKAIPMDRLWADQTEERATADPTLLVDVAGFEGPLDDMRHRGAISGWKAEGLPWLQG